MDVKVSSSKLDHHQTTDSSGQIGFQNAKKTPTSTPRTKKMFSNMVHDEVLIINGLFFF